MNGYRYIALVCLGGVVVIIVSLVVILVLPGTLAFSPGQATPTPGVQAQTLVEQFNQGANANDRIKSLAGLLKLPGHEKTMRGLFDTLSQPDKFAMFALDDPHAVDADLVAVVKILYTDLPNDTGGNELLHIMDRSLTTVGRLGARSLSVEIEQWLQGRESYNEGQGAKAVVAYNEAIRLNPRNPGTHLDRALAYAQLGQHVHALDDLTQVMRLKTDPMWKDRVQKVLSADQRLYNALWSQKEKYPTLAALVPTPTQTPAPTRTPAPSRTPTPTLTPTVVIRAISPSYSIICRNPVTFRWTGPLQLYQIYRVRVRYNSPETGMVNFPQSGQLTEPIWQSHLLETVPGGDRNYRVYGEIEWQVLIIDTRSEETVSRSDWFHFYFDTLNGQSCP